MDHAGLKACPVDLVQHFLKQVVLGHGDYFTVGAAEMSINSGDGQRLHTPIDGKDLFHLVRQETVPAHAGIQFQVYLRHGGALGGHVVDGHGIRIGAHGEDHAQVQQGIDLSGIRRAPDH